MKTCPNCLVKFLPDIWENCPVCGCNYEQIWMHALKYFVAITHSSMQQQLKHFTSHLNGKGDL